MTRYRNLFGLPFIALLVVMMSACGVQFGGQPLGTSVHNADGTITIPEGESYLFTSPVVHEATGNQLVASGCKATAKDGEVEINAAATSFETAITGTIDWDCTGATNSPAQTTAPALTATPATQAAAPTAMPTDAGVGASSDPRMAGDYDLPSELTDGDTSTVALCPAIMDIDGNLVEIKPMTGSQAAINARSPFIVPNDGDMHVVYYDRSYVAGDQVPAGASTIHGCFVNNNDGSAPATGQTDAGVINRDTMVALDGITDFELLPQSNGALVTLDGPITLPANVEADHMGVKYVPGETIPADNGDQATFWYVGRGE